MSYFKVSDKMTCANSADPDQTAPEGEFRPKKLGIKCLKIFNIYRIGTRYI